MDEVLAALVGARRIAVHHFDGSVYFWQRMESSGLTIWAREDTLPEKNPDPRVLQPVSLEHDRFAELITHYGLFFDVETPL